MPPQKKSNTLQSYVASTLEQITPDVTLVAHQDTISVVGETYTVGFEWVLGDNASKEDIPPYPGGNMQLTADSEVTVSPTFSITDEHIDSVIMSGTPSHSMGNTKREAKINENGFNTLSTLLNEVHLSESQFVNMVEGDTQLSECIELVSVVQGGSNEHETAIEMANEMVNKSDQFDDTDTVNLDHRLQFMVEVINNEKRFPIADGIPTKERFSHVETLTINGTRYPVRIDTFLFGSGEIADGQVVHIGEFSASCDEATPQISLQDELDHIDWREYVSDTSAWPDGPGVPTRHQNGELLNVSGGFGL